MYFVIMLFQCCSNAFPPLILLAELEMNKINKVYSVHVLKVPLFCFLGLYYNHISQTVIFSVWSLFVYIMPKRKDISSDLREAIVPVQQSGNVLFQII